MDIERFKLYRATVRLRRGEGFNVKPEAEQMDGKELMFRPGWEMTREDTSIYVGEWAMCPERAMPSDDWPVDAPGWIATGDLENLTMVTA